MPDLRSIRAHVSTEHDGTTTSHYGARLGAAMAAGIVCQCGDTVASRDADDPAVPRREDGRARGVCHCFRARARTVPADANR